MRIGLIVDGQAEFRSFPHLLGRIDCPHTIVKTLYTDIQPFAPAQQIAERVKKKLPIMVAKRANKVIVLLDREDRNVCPGDWAGQIQLALSTACAGVSVDSFAVVIKNHCYENWLVGDTTALEAMPQRFSLSASDIKKVSPNKADQVNAQALLKQTARKGSYSKVEDAMRIAAYSDPTRIAANSRSFRRLMRMLDNPTYLSQSRRP